ncbi:MAG: L-rhamnose mutarotase [Clostridiaceae bacterium]|nr:L-rhamnose mutarotase [Clostridiaceae bacterium]
MQCQENNNAISYAGFGVRFAAHAIDFLILGLVLLLVRIPALIAFLVSPDNPFTNPFLFKFSAYDILIYLLGALYYVVMTYYSGATLGKKFLNIKVVSADGNKLTFINVLYRETIGKYLSGALIFIGYFMIALDEQKRSLHDRLCDTRVIYNFKIPVKVVERKPEKKYAWIWNVKEEFMEEYKKLYSDNSSGILEEQKNAGYRNPSVFNNGNQYYYIFECNNIEHANNYLSNSQICKDWYESVSNMLEGAFELKKPEIE